jgi:hypothetical protein
MPSIKKPNFNAPRTQDLKKGLDKLEEYVKDVQNNDGTVDMDKLESKVKRSRTDHVKESFEVLKDEFSRTETRRVSSGCGGSRTRTVSVPAEELTAAETTSVMDALLRAKSRVDNLDANLDGTVDRDEAMDAPRRGLAAKLAKAGVETTVETYLEELGSWRDALADTAEKLEARAEFSEIIDDADEFHAKSKDGKEALKWAYREILVDMGATDWELQDTLYDLDDALDNAEAGFLRHAPAYRHSTGRGHLSDNELKGFFDTDDLKKLGDKKRDAVLNAVGDWDDWVAGADLPGADQVDDPDFSGGGTTNVSGGGC